MADWKTTARYYPFSRFLRETFGSRVRKITVNGGFSCPNRDGTVGVGGCSFCVNESFSRAADAQPLPIRQQVAQAIAQAKERGRDEKFMVYFQPFTNTYADTKTLKERYDEAEAVYRRDLKWNHNNGWSLFGLQQALQAQGKRLEAQEVMNEYRKAWGYSDVELSRSHF